MEGMSRKGDLYENEKGRSFCCGCPHGFELGHVRLLFAGKLIFGFFQRC